MSCRRDVLTNAHPTSICRISPAPTYTPAMDVLDRIDTLAADLDRLRGHEAARAEIAAELELMRRDAAADIDIRRVHARALATILRRERSLAQTPVGISLLALTAEYAS